MYILNFVKYQFQLDRIPASAGRCRVKEDGNLLGKLENGVLRYAPRKIVIDGKTIFNPGDDILRGQGQRT